MGDVVDHAIAYIDRAIGQLSQAYDQRDWESIQALDEKLRVGFIEVTSRLDSSRNERLLQRLEQLIVLYREVIAGCEAHRSDLREQMLGLHQGQRGSRAYTNVSNFALSDIRNQPWRRHE